MSDVSEAFVRALGAPHPKATNGLRFSDPLKQALWDSIYEEIGAGWFLDGFAWLFGPGLERLLPPLDFWAPAEGERTVLGRNAYGAVLFMDHEGPVDETVRLVTTLTGTVWSDPRIGFANLFGAWLPQGLIPGFLEPDLHREWVAANGPLGDGDVLQLVKPVTSGGRLAVDNLRPKPLEETLRRRRPGKRR